MYVDAAEPRHVLSFLAHPRHLTATTSTLLLGIATLIEEYAAIRAHLYHLASWQVKAAPPPAPKNTKKQKKSKKQKPEKSHRPPSEDPTLKFDDDYRRELFVAVLAWERIVEASEVADQLSRLLMQFSNVVARFIDQTASRMTAWAWCRSMSWSKELIHTMRQFVTGDQLVSDATAIEFIKRLRGDGNRLTNNELTQLGDWLDEPRGKNEEKVPF